jgi:predicted TPR repeat methyltransferase
LQDNGDIEGGDPLAHAQDLIDADRAWEAARFLRERLAAGEGGFAAQLLLGRALLAAGKNVQAMDAAREAVMLQSDRVDAALLYAQTLLATHNPGHAITEMQRALRLDPGSVAARVMLASAWIDIGEIEHALIELGRLDPDEVPEHAALMARIDAARGRTRSDDGYIRHLFDEYSAYYDNHMRQQLQYQAPEILRELAAMVMPGAKDLTILDLGCGTGLSGEVFAPIAAVMDGIDLSPAMLEKARARGIYRRLRAADLETELVQGGPDCDLVLAIDTMCYFGDLAPTLAGVRNRLKPGGFFLFTVETAGGDGFEKSEKRRWHHSENYLRQAAAAAGLDVVGLVACTPRFETKQPVPGFAVALQTPA